MSKKSDYYKQGISAYLKGITLCAYAPLSAKGLDWAEGYADAKLADDQPEEEVLPTIEDAKNAIIEECCETEDCEECPE
jgi:hypothetical protein